MLKNPTTAIIAVLVVAFFVVAIYITRKPADLVPVAEVAPVEVVAPVENSVETVVTPVEVTPAE